jgi:hypothetical protein
VSRESRRWAWEARERKRAMERERDKATRTQVLTKNTHPVQRGSVMAALAWIVFWAVGIGLFFVSQFWAALALFSISIVGTAWIFSSEIRNMPLANLHRWPWLGLFFIALQIIVTSWVIYSGYQSSCTDINVSKNKGWNVGGDAIHIEV